MTDSTIHDPLSRQMENEPRLPLMGRDILSPGLERLYAILREASPDYKAKAHQLLERLFLTNDSRPKNPHKDREHAWSARKIADESEAFYNAHIRGEPQRNRAPGTTEIMTTAVVTETKPAPDPANLYDVGDRIVLTAPVHYTISDGLIAQILTGTEGVVAELHKAGTGPVFYMVAFNAPHHKALRFVHFDRCKKVEQ